MVRSDSRYRAIHRATTAVAAVLLLLHAGEAAAQRVRRGGGYGGEGREEGVREEGGYRGGAYDERGGYDNRGAAEGEDRGQEERGDNTGSNGWDQGGSGGQWQHGGNTVDTDKTTNGDTTTRDTTVTGADGQSATHTSSVTKDDGSFDASGSTTTANHGSTTTTTNGTYSDGKVDSMNTTVNGTNADGVTGTHDGNWNRDGDTAGYHGSTSTSNGRDSDAAGEVTKTNDGYVARGAAVDNQGAAAGTVVRNGDQVDGRSVTTNGETVNRNAVYCDHGDCTRATVATDQVPYGARVPYFVPYSSYPCPGGVDMVPSASGDIVYSCGVTPVLSTTVPISAAMVANSASAAAMSNAQITSASVVMYQISPDAVVYVTSYQPQGVYSSATNGRFYWVPGPAAASDEVSNDINAAVSMEQPSANATVITYAIAGNLVYLTGQPPLRGFYAQPADSLFAWMPGVTQPTQAQRDAIGTAVVVHHQEGAKALADQVARAN